MTEWIIVLVKPKARVFGSYNDQEPKTLIQLCLLNPNCDVL